VTGALKAEDPLNPRSYFVTGRTRWLVQVYYSQSDVFSERSFSRLGTEIGISLLLSFNRNFSRSLPWRSYFIHIYLFKRQVEIV
jgi:hypothetical protein